MPHFRSGPIQSKLAVAVEGSLCLCRETECLRRMFGGSLDFASTDAAALGQLFIEFAT